jgi:hypothetical protein
VRRPALCVFALNRGMRPERSGVVFCGFCRNLLEFMRKRLSNAELKLTARGKVAFSARRLVTVMNALYIFDAALYKNNGVAYFIFKSLWSARVC